MKGRGTGYTEQLKSLNLKIQKATSKCCDYSKKRKSTCQTNHIYQLGEFTYKS